MSFRGRTLCPNMAGRCVFTGPITVQTAFADCRNLKKIYIPGTVATIAKDAFEGCDSITLWSESGSEVERYAKENNYNFELFE